MRPPKRAWTSLIEFGTYMYELVVTKRAHPEDDLLSRLCTVEAESPTAKRSGLDDIEIAGFAALIAAAGSETVTKLVGNAVVLFSRNPEQWQKVLARPGDDPGCG